MISQLAKLASTLKFHPEEISMMAGRVYRSALQESRHMRAGNFEAISSEDLKILFHHYDRLFFSGHCVDAVDGARAELRFRISPRMTSAGGKTTRMERRPAAQTTRPLLYEITVSSTLLFHTFSGESSPITVSGIRCRDRLEALQRVFEHEMIHLIELLSWKESSCSRARFKSIARRVFAHTETTHRLITPRERAAVDFGIKPGDRVVFSLKGTRYAGLVTRITKRATVLVEDKRGTRYSDGRSYTKFYVPLHFLRPHAQ